MTAQHNIVVIGGGGAGLRAAIAIAETNPHLDVAIVSKVYPMRSHTVSAEGGAAAVTGDDDSSMNTRTTRYPVATGCVTKMRSRLSWPRRPKSWCSSSIGAVRGAVNQTGALPFARSAG